VHQRGWAESRPQAPEESKFEKYEVRALCKVMMIELGFSTDLANICFDINITSIASR